MDKIPGKPKWGEGPWQSEPDLEIWVDPQTDLPCLAARGMVTGAWCGYVGIPPGRDAVRIKKKINDIAIHGGITFAGRRRKCFAADARYVSPAQTPGPH
jgi:hypothetical protein